MKNPLTCIHVQDGLCPDCQAEYEEDPEAYIEYGDHPDGIARWKSLQKEMDEEAAWARTHAPQQVDSDIPF